MSTLQRFRLLPIILLAIALVLALAWPAAARTIHSDNVRVGAEEVIDDDLFAAGNDIVIEGTVNGDVYAAGQTVTITGTINGDAIIAAETVNISGQIGQDVRAAGRTIQVSGANIGDSLTVAGQNITTDAASTIAGGFIFAGARTILRAPVGRGVTGAAEDTVLESSVGRDALIAGSGLDLASGANVAGDLKFYSDNRADIRPGAVVTGQTEHIRPPRNNQDPRPVIFGFWLWSLLAAVLIGLLMLWLTRRPVQQVAAQITANPGLAFGIGLLAILVALPAFILLLITFVGIPLALILGVLFIITLYLSKIFVAIAAAEAWGHYVGIQDQNLLVKFLFAILAYYVLTLIPVAGALMQLAAGAFGLGAVILTLTGRRPRHAPATAS